MDTGASMHVWDSFGGHRDFWDPTSSRQAHQDLRKAPSLSKTPQSPHIVLDGLVIKGTCIEAPTQTNTCRVCVLYSVYFPLVEK